MSRLASQILGQMREMRVPLTVNDLSVQLGQEPSDVMIALHELMQAGKVISKVRGLKLRPYYELA